MSKTQQAIGHARPAQPTNKESAKKPLLWRGKWFCIRLSFFFLIVAFLGVWQSSSLFAGPSSTLQSYSTLFMVGQRGVGTSNYYSAAIAAVSYGEGPTEPSLASTMDGSLFKNSSPLTVITPESARSNITTYIVKQGDKPALIAASFGITTNTLFWANNLTDGEYIRSGQELIILPVSGVRYKVKAGDTISEIAGRFKGDVPKIIVFNDLGPDGSIYEGEYVIIPDGEMPRQVNYRNSSPKYISNFQNLDEYFIHPTAGVGYRSRGIHGHNAVDVAAPCWTPIYAAAGGTVTVSDGYGWNGGYGKYVRISHENNTAAIYAHNIQNEVSPGQNVKQGQIIAYMGSTGRSTGCHVHWEVFEALNPLR